MNTTTGWIILKEVFRAKQKLKPRWIHETVFPIMFVDEESKVPILDMRRFRTLADEEGAKY